MSEARTPAAPPSTTNAATTAEPAASVAIAEEALSAEPPEKKVVKPGKRRAPRKEPPITQDEVVFCHLVMKGTGNPSSTQLERIEAAGARIGLDETMASRVYHRKHIQVWITKCRERMMTQMVREEVRLLRRVGFSRDDVLTILHGLATTPPELTKGSILGQVAAVAEMSKVMGLVVAPRSPDDFFKNRTEEEIANFAEYGTFTNPKVK